MGEFRGVRKYRVRPGMQKKFIQRNISAPRFLRLLSPFAFRSPSTPLAKPFNRFFFPILSMCRPSEARATTSPVVFLPHTSLKVIAYALWSRLFRSLLLVSSPLTSSSRKPTASKRPSPRWRRSLHHFYGTIIILRDEIRNRLAARGTNKALMGKSLPLLFA